MSEKPKKHFNWSACVLCELLGGYVGYCVSYFFQNELIQSIGFGVYARIIFGIIFPLKDSQMLPNVFFIAWGGIFIGVVLASVVYKICCRLKRNAQSDSFNEHQDYYRGRER